MFMVDVVSDYFSSLSNWDGGFWENWKYKSYVSLFELDIMSHIKNNEQSLESKKIYI